MLGGWGEDMILWQQARCVGVVAWSVIRSRVILVWGVEGRGADAGAGAGGEVFHFYISLVVVKW